MRLHAAVPLVLAITFATAATSESPQLEDQGLAIYGTVMRPGTREPVAGARVGLRAGDGFAALLEAEVTLVTADASGRFSFTGLDPGSYRLNAVAGGDPDDRLSTFETTFVDLTDSGLPLDVQVWLLPRSEISGRITDAEGNPIAGVAVGLRVLGRLFGRPTLGPTFDNLASVPTDEDGRYLMTVVPGEYYLFVESREADLVRRFYPGVLFPEDALTVTVPPGVDVPGIDIVLAEIAQVRLRFRFAVPDSVPGVQEPVSSYLPEGSVPLQIQVQPRGRGLIASPAYMVAAEALGDDSYLTAPLPPGEYEVTLGYPGELRRALSEVLGRAAVDIPIPDPLARFSLTLDGREADGEVDLGAIAALASVSVPGRVIVRAEATFDSDMFPVMLLLSSEGIGGSQYRATVGADGSFVVESVSSGLYALSYNEQNLPDGWYIQALRSGARNVDLDGLEVTAGFTNAIEVVLGNDGGRIEGVVRDSDDVLVPGTQVLLIPLPNRRGPFYRILPVDANESGAYVLDAVPPGEYRLLALDLAGLRTTPGVWDSPEFLRDYELRGERITVDPDARMSINLEAIPYQP